MATSWLVGLGGKGGEEMVVGGEEPIEEAWVGVVEMVAEVVPQEEEEAVHPGEEVLELWL